jgi:hypothetical protein
MEARSSAIDVHKVNNCIKDTAVNQKEIISQCPSFYTHLKIYEIYETFVYNSILTQLIAQADFGAFNRCESFKSYIVNVIFNVVTFRMRKINHFNFACTIANVCR